MVCQLCPGTMAPVTKGGVTGDWGLPGRVWGVGARVFRGQVSRGLVTGSKGQGSGPSDLLGWGVRGYQAKPGQCA